MRNFCATAPFLSMGAILTAAFAVLCSCAWLIAQENSSSASALSVEQQALRVLNDSDWARTVTPTLQDALCTYQNPAFPGLFAQDRAEALDVLEPASRNGLVKPDHGEYLIRFQSARPVQAAVQQLLAMGDKWTHDYGRETTRVDETDPPTDLANKNYNLADMITVIVVLKRPGPDGKTFFDDVNKPDGKILLPLIWPCAGLRTSNGQVFAHVLPHGQNLKSLELAFPRWIAGKPLISGIRQKVEFRLVLNQTVFETSFFVSGDDVLDGSERVLYLPSGFTGSSELAKQAD